MLLTLPSLACHVFPALTAFVVTVFLLVSLGLFLGGLPFLQLDRTGVVLLGAIALIATEVVLSLRGWDGGSSPDARPACSPSWSCPRNCAWAVSTPVGRRTRPAGRYRHRNCWPRSLPLSAALSAVFSNDVVCLAMAPILIRRPGATITSDSVPARAGRSANVGSALTLIGNPQNMLIGERLHLPFPVT